MTLQRLERSGDGAGKPVARACRRLDEPLAISERELLDGIERERQRLLKKDVPLVDGSLDETAAYDGTLTIRAACAVSKRPRSARFLYHLIREIRPRFVLELGTNVGISSAYLAAALLHCGDGGRLMTLERSQYRLRVARDVHRNLGLDNVDYVPGLFVETLPSVLEWAPPVDVAFIDGHHQHQPTLDYFGLIAARTSPRSVFVFDDIRWSPGMEAAWREVTVDGRIRIAADLGSMGVCVGAEGPSGSRHVTRPISSVLR